MSNARQKAIMAAIAPYAKVANFSIPDVMAAANKAVPDCEPVEVLEAFNLLASSYEEVASAASAELDRRGRADG